MEEMCRIFLESIPCPVWIMGVDRRYKFVNNCFRTFHSLGNIDIVDKTIDEVIPNKLRSMVINRIEEVFSNKKLVVYDCKVDKNYTQCYLLPLFDSRNNIYAVGGLVIDISDTKANQIKIFNQKKILQTIIDTIPDPIFYKDINSKYLGANKVCRNELKVMIEDSIIGKNDSEIMFDKDLAEKFMRDDKKIMASREVIHTKPNMVFPDGTVRAKECVKAPLIDDNDNVIGVVGLARDVTERKQMEDRLRYLSYTDILTGLYNRTSFEERIKNFKKEEYLPLGIIMGDVNGLKLVNDAFGHAEGDKLLVSIANVLRKCCGEFADIFRWGGDEFVIIIPNADFSKCEKIIKDIKDSCKCKDCGKSLIELSIALGKSIKNDLNGDIYDSLKEAESTVYKSKLFERKSVVNFAISSLLKSLGKKSFETEDHVADMVKNSIAIGNKLNFSLLELENLILATELHDIGKIVIDEDILMKQGKLSDKEYEIIKTHCEKGYRIIKASNGLEDVAEGVLYHHERYDGTGYPMGLKGAHIPLISRIISVVDAYVVMTNGKSYKSAITKEEAIEELIRCKGGQFDPAIVDCFVEVVR